MWSRWSRVAQLGSRRRPANGCSPSSPTERGRLTRFAVSEGRFKLHLGTRSMALSPGGCPDQQVRIPPSPPEGPTRQAIPGPELCRSHARVTEGSAGPSEGDAERVSVAAMRRPRRPRHLIEALILLAEDFDEERRSRKPRTGAAGLVNSTSRGPTPTTAAFGCAACLRTKPTLAAIRRRRAANPDSSPDITCRILRLRHRCRGRLPQELPPPSGASRPAGRFRRGGWHSSWPRAPAARGHKQRGTGIGRL